MHRKGKDMKNKQTTLDTIQKTANIFDTALNALFWILVVCACICAGFAILSFIPGMPMDRLMKVEDIHLDTDIIRFTFSDNVMNKNPRLFLIYAAFLIMIPAAFTALICRELKKVVSPIKEGRPFTHEVSAGMKHIAVIYFTGEIIGAMAKGIIGTLIYRTFDLGANMTNSFIKAAELNIHDNVDIMVPILLLVISWIIKYGENLQKLEDETI